MLKNDWPQTTYPFVPGHEIVSTISASSSPLGSPAATARMLDFAARHKIESMVETFDMQNVDDAMEHLHSGKARYRIVMKN